MSDLKTSIILDLAGNLQRRASQYERSMTRLGSNGSRSMRMLSRSTAMASQGIDRLGNRYMALATGAAGIGTVRMLGNLEQRFMRLGNQANLTDTQVDSLKQRIYEVAKAPEIRVDPGEITNAIEKIVEKTGDLDLAQSNLRNIALAIQATGAGGQDIGAMIADMQEKFGLRSKDEFLAVLDTLVLQGKAGAFTLENLATQGERVTAAYAAMGRTGPTAAREMGALLQLAKKGTGGPEQAATAFERLLSELKSKSADLGKKGIQVWDPEQLKLGKKIARSVPDILKEIMRATKGDPEKLTKVFGDESLRALTAMQIEFQQTGGFATLDKYLGLQGDGATLTRDSIRAAKTFNAALGNLVTVGKQFADKELTEPIKELTEYLNGLEPGAVERWLQVGKNLALVGGGLVAAQKLGLFKLGGRMLSRRGGIGLPGMSGGLPGAMGAIPVYIVDGPMSVLNGPGGKPGGGAAGTIAKASPWVMGLKGGGLAMLPAAGAALVGYGSRKGMSALGEWHAGMASTGRLHELRARQMVMGGGSDSFQVRTIDAELDRRFQGELKITIDSEGQPHVEQIDSDNLAIDVDAGQMMRSH